MASYEDNVYNWLKRKGLAAKYEHAGIYCIKVDEKIVYVGKSRNMLRRIAQHYVGIKQESKKKYRIISEVQRKGHSITFDVLYDAKSKRHTDMIVEIGEKEGEYIRHYHPILNAQIPKEEDWSKWDINDVDARKVLEQLL